MSQLEHTVKLCPRCMHPSDLRMPECMNCGYIFQNTRVDLWPMEGPPPVIAPPPQPVPIWPWLFAAAGVTFGLFSLLLAVVFSRT